MFGADVGEFGTEGLKMTPRDPMKRWTLFYKGQMWYEISTLINKIEKSSLTCYFIFIFI